MTAPLRACNWPEGRPWRLRLAHGTAPPLKRTAPRRLPPRRRPDTARVRGTACPRRTAHYSTGPRCIRSSTRPDSEAARQRLRAPTTRPHPPSLRDICAINHRLVHSIASFLFQEIQRSCGRTCPSMEHRSPARNA
jgi:hypothetical protein